MSEERKRREEKPVACPAVRYQVSRMCLCLCFFLRLRLCIAPPPCRQPWCTLHLACVPSATEAQAVKAVRCGRSTGLLTLLQRSFLESQPTSSAAALRLTCSAVQLYM